MKLAVLLVLVLALAYVCADTGLDFDEKGKGKAVKKHGAHMKGSHHMKAPGKGKKASAAAPKKKAKGKKKGKHNKAMKKAAKAAKAKAKAAKSKRKGRKTSNKHQKKHQGRKKNKYQGRKKNKHHGRKKNKHHGRKKNKRHGRKKNKHHGRKKNKHHGRKNNKHHGRKNHKRKKGKKNKRHRRGRKKKRCAKGLRGKKCRRGHRCKRRHKACHNHCLSKAKHTKKQCTDICYHHAKRRACNRCHNTKCRHHRHACLVDLKSCQGKCHSADVTCLRACRCTLHKKAVAKPVAPVKPAVKPAVVAKPVVAKPAVKTVTPKKPVPATKVQHKCPCSHSVRKCSAVKQCTLRDTKPVKKCVQQENTEVVLCECAKKNAQGKCVEKKMHQVCIQKDTKGKCIKQEARCMPSCAVVNQKTKVCSKYNKQTQMKCVKYEMEASHKCQKEGYSHKCVWECVKRGCPGKNQLTRIEHPIIEKKKPVKKETVKILDSKGHEYTEKELKALKQHDVKAYNSIIKALKTAEGQVATPAQAYEIKEAENKIESQTKGL